MFFLASLLYAVLLFLSNIYLDGELLCQNSMGIVITLAVLFNSFSERLY